MTYFRLGIESPKSNTIYLAASGINDILDEAPFRVYGVKGGVYVSRADGEGGRLRVYDLGGSLIIDDDPEDGETYFMAPGVYIVTIGGGRPTKITVR